MIQPKFSIPDGTYDLNIGKSFSKSSKNRQEYHTLRCRYLFNVINPSLILDDFKPKSVNAEQEAYIATSQHPSDDIHVIL
jgi:hypothetical protein